MPELLAILEASRDRLESERRFLADLHNVEFSVEKDETDPWEDMKARVFSGGKAKNSKDILALQGQNAQQKGFGIGNGLSYTDSKSVKWWDE